MMTFDDDDDDDDCDDDDCDNANDDDDDDWGLGCANDGGLRTAFLCDSNNHS